MWFFILSIQRAKKLRSEGIQFAAIKLWSHTRSKTRGCAVVERRPNCRKQPPLNPNGMILNRVIISSQFRAKTQIDQKKSWDFKREILPLIARLI